MLRQESIEAQTVFRGHSGWGSGEFPRAKALLEVVVRSPVCFKDGLKGPAGLRIINVVLSGRSRRVI